MSSAVPIHPFRLLARRGGTVVSSSTNVARAYLPSSSRNFASTPSASAKSSKKLEAQSTPTGDPKSGVSRAPPTSASSSQKNVGQQSKNGSPLDARPSASNQGNPSLVKLTDKRSSPSPNEKKEETTAKEGESRGTTKDASSSGEDGRGGQMEGGVQKIFKGSSMHPAGVEQERQAAAAVSSGTTLQEGSVRPQTTSVDEVSISESNSASDTSKLAEGIVIHANSPSRRTNSTTSSSSPLSQDSSQSSSPNSPPLTSGGGSESFVPPNSETGTGSGDGGSGPPATTQVPELGNIRPPNPLHPFDTHLFIKRLQSANFMARRVDDSQGDVNSSADPSAGTSLSSNKRHDPAEAIMEATRHLLVSRGERVLDHHISKTEVENQAYLFTAALSELRTELQVRARNDAAALRSMVTLLQREVDGLNQKMREDVGGMKHDIQVDMNNRKGEAKEEQNTLEQEIQDLNNRFTISISDLKTEIEQNIKWDATRRALTVVFGCVVILIATLTAADYLTREEVEEVHPARRTTEAQKGAAAEAAYRTAPRSAEELGLVANYDDGDGSRFV